MRIENKNTIILGAFETVDKKETINTELKKKKNREKIVNYVTSPRQIAQYIYYICLCSFQERKLLIRIRYRIQVIVNNYRSAFHHF